MARSKTRCVPEKFLKEKLSCLSRNFPFLPKALLEAKAERAWEGLPDFRKAEYKEDKTIRKSSLSFSFEVDCDDASQKDSNSKAGHRHYGRKATQASSATGRCDKEWAEVSFTRTDSVAIKKTASRARRNSSACTSAGGVASNAASVQLQPDALASVASDQLAVSSATQWSSSLNNGRVAAARYRSGPNTCSKKKQPSLQNARKKPSRVLASAGRKKRATCRRGRKAALDVPSAAPPSDTSESPPPGPPGCGALRTPESTRGLADAYRSSALILADCLSELERTTATPPATYDDDVAILDVSFYSNSSPGSCTLFDASDITGDSCTELPELDCIVMHDIADTHSPSPSQRREADPGASSGAAVPAATDEVGVAEGDLPCSRCDDIAEHSAVGQPGGASHACGQSPGPATSSRPGAHSGLQSPVHWVPARPGALPLDDESCACPTPHDGDVASSTAAAGDVAMPSSESANCLLMQPPLMSLFDSPPATPKTLSRRSLRSAMQAGPVAPSASAEGVNVVVAGGVFM